MKTFANFSLILIFYFISTLSGVCFAQERQIGNKLKENQISEKRLALVIGNGGYQKTDTLPNPINDAIDMTQALKDLGFEVISGTNQTKQQMENLIRQFGNRLAETKAVGLFYYAGHGISSNGTNYLIPVDADIQAEDEVEYSSVSINFVLNKMAAAKNSLNIVILDACRNNPFARNWRNYREIGDSGGLVKITPPTGTIMLYATQPGNIASDGKGRNGLFTESLLRQIKRPNVELDAMIKFLASDVADKSKNKQLPWREGIAFDDFYFAGKEISNIASNSSQIEQILKPTNITGEQAFWQEAQKSNTIAMYEAYISNYSKGEFIPLANFKIRELLLKAKAVSDEADKLMSWNVKNYEKAVELYTKAVEINSKYESAYISRGICYFRLEKYDESIEDFTKAIAINPRSDEAYYNRSKVYYKKTQYNQALKDINAYFNIPVSVYNSFYKYLLRGLIYSELRNYDLAVNDFNKSLEVGFGSPEFVYFARGTTYLKNQQYDLAIEDFSKTLLEMKGYSAVLVDYFFILNKSDVFHNRGKSYLGKREYNLAIADFNEAIGGGWLNAEAYENRASAYEAIGDKIRAKDDREKAEKLKKQQKQ